MRLTNNSVEEPTPGDGADYDPQIDTAADDAPPTLPPPGEPSSTHSGGAPLGGPTHEDAAQLEQVLNDDFQFDLTGDELEAVRRWQGTDRFYQRVQMRMREQLGEFDDDEADHVMDVLGDILDRHPLPDDVVLWRGVRNAGAMFGRSTANLHDFIGRTIPPGAFIATGTSRAEAMGFTDPGSAPVLLRVLATRGTRALWVPPVGHPELANQREFLLGASALYIVGVQATEEGLTEVTVEVR